MARDDTRPPRLLYVDWLRGLAVLIMIVWHTLDAWTRPGDRTGTVFWVITFIGGWAAPLFLFLAGISVALSGQAILSKTRSPGPEGPGLHPLSTRLAAGWRLQKRGWQIFGLAHVFRLQSFLLNPAASWSSMLKPDILNILGLGIVAASFCWARAGTLVRRIVWLIGPAAAFVLLAPGSRVWLWPAEFRPYVPRLEAYIRPVSNIGVFSVFPWVGFVFVGTFIGMVMAQSPSRGEGARLQAGLAAAGLAIGLAGALGFFLPAITTSEFWTTSVSYFLLRTGAMVLGFPLAWLWLKRAGADRSSWMLMFGRASLFVYWVHVELAYGFFTYPLHRTLPLGWAIAVFAVFTAAMLGAAHLWIHRRRPIVPAYLVVARAAPHRSS